MTDQRAAWREMIRTNRKPVGARRYLLYAEDDVLDFIDEAVAQELERCVNLAAGFMSASNWDLFKQAIRALGEGK